MLAKNIITEDNSTTQIKDRGGGVFCLIYSTAFQNISKTFIYQRTAQS